MTASAPRTRWNQVKTARKGKTLAAMRTERAWAKAHPHRLTVTRYKIVTPTLAALERAAMRWYGSYRWNGEAIHNIRDRLWMALINAAAAHASKKRKGTK